jgi:DHA3 family macrolide efflux protein-like MFS transporter
MAVAMPFGMVVFGPLADVMPIEVLLVAAGILTFVVIGLAVWLPAGQRAIAAAREAARAADPAAGAVAAEEAMHKDGPHG